MGTSAEYVSFEGSDKEFDAFLSEYYEGNKTELFLHSMGTVYDALNETETVRIVLKDSCDVRLGLVTTEMNYHLNVRKTTLALIGLIMDITLTKGFASFALEMFGVTAGKIRRLTPKEKQILLLINAEKILIDEKTDTYEINDERDYGFTSDQIKSIIDKLVDDEVVKRKGRELKIL